MATAATFHKGPPSGIDPEEHKRKLQLYLERTRDALEDGVLFLETYFSEMLR